MLKKLKTMLLLGAALMTMGSGTALAAGNHTVVSPNAFTMIGEFGGYAWLGTSTDLGVTCSWKMLGVVGAGDYGLVENWNINGTTSADYINVLTSSQAWCGVTLNLIAPFHTINLFGQGGNDFLIGGWSSDAVNGMSGNDDITCRRTNCIIDGGSGNDWFQQSQHASLTINASTADDRACISNAAGTGPGTVFSLNGGTNTTANPGDRRCGTGTSVHTGWETVNCSECGL